LGERAIAAPAGSEEHRNVMESLARKGELVTRNGLRKVG
jgi:hypothetical protein